MTKKFSDYPADLQRIVELTPDEWVFEDWDRAFLTAEDDVIAFPDSCKNNYSKRQYNACRTAYLHESAANIKAGEVEWRGLCEELSSRLEFTNNAYIGLSAVLSDSFDYSNDNDIVGTMALVNKARTALEATK